MERGESVLVTGSIGFICRHMTNALLSKRANVVVADQLIVSNSNPDTWKKPLDRYYTVCGKDGFRSDDEL